jgi:hypothetical protein
MIISHFNQIEIQINELVTLINTGFKGIVICSAENIEQLQFIKEMLKGSLLYQSDSIISSELAKTTKELINLYEINIESKDEDLLTILKKN